MSKKVGIITQARLSSSRLPEKILLKAKDKTLLEHHLLRLQQSSYQVYMATTQEEGVSEKIIPICKQYNVPYVQGSLNHVLDRFYQVAKTYHLDVIVRVTSDCPLVDGNLVSVGIEEYLKLNNPMLYYCNTSPRTFPRGLDFEIFSFEMLQLAIEKAKTTSEIEHVTPYFYNGNNTDIKIKGLLGKENYSQYRITLDTESDYKLIKTLIEDYDCEQKNYLDIIDVLNKNKDLNKMNEHIVQKSI